MSTLSDIKKVSKLKHIDVLTDTHEDHLVVHDTEDASTDPATIAEPQILQEDTHTDHSQNLSIPNTHQEQSQGDVPTADAHPESNSTVAQEGSEPQSTTTCTGKDCPETIKTIFMGTGDFAAYILDEMLTHKKCDLVAIVTQPDKKLGRKKSGINRSLAPNPVRDIAVAHNIPLIQPFKFDDEAIAQLTNIAPDAIVVASYGKILPKAIIDLPKIAAVNIHTSLLPKLRGSSPIQNALLLGLKETGVTIMLMDEGMDTGDILAQEKVPIDDHEKADALTQKLSRIGAKLFIDTCPDIINKKITPIKQDPAQATLCQMIDREDGHIQWTDTTEEVYNRFRSLYPWPGIFGYWEATENQMMRIKLRGIYPYDGELTDEQKELLPGTVFIARDQLCVKTFDTAIILEAIQPECKAVMPIYDFLNGYKNFEGAVLR